jgi:hypothetical protein
MTSYQTKMPAFDIGLMNLSDERSMVDYSISTTLNLLSKRSDRRKWQSTSIVGAHKYLHSFRNENQPAVPCKAKPHLLARVQECNTDSTDTADPHVHLVKYTGLSSPDIIPVNAISAVIGRVRYDSHYWAIIDRSSSGARTQFVDDEGNKEY